MNKHKPEANIVTIEDCEHDRHIITMRRFLRGLNRKRNIQALMEKYMYAAVMLEHGGNQTRAARFLGVTRVTLRNKLKTYFGTASVAYYADKELLVLLSEKLQEKAIC